MTKKFYSNGKLLLTGEYAVLDGALSLAVPTKQGQSLEVTTNNTHQLIWRSYDEKKRRWFEGYYDRASLKILSTTDENVAATLQKILLETRKLAPGFLSEKIGFEVVTYLSFPRDWGLGSSSTLINNIAQWAQIDPYKLLWNAFSGSAYDIACAMNDTPIHYRVKHQKPNVRQVAFHPIFSEQIYFVYLNKKQNSREGIQTYRKATFDSKEFLVKISSLTQLITVCKELTDFQELITTHEKLVGSIIKQTPVKQKLFSDFDGAIKSLGAWGGDFILAAGKGDIPTYFKHKGYTTVVPYSLMVL